MKKMNNKGFMLTETLIVSTFLVTTLLFIYMQFNTVTNSYNTSFKYNTVNSMYALNNIADYIKTEEIDKLKNDLTNSEYIDISKCPNTYFKETEYCQVLFETLKVKTVIFTLENLKELKSKQTDLDQTIVDFIDYLNYDQTDGYRVIAEFNDNTFASLKVE